MSLKTYSQYVELRLPRKRRCSGPTVVDLFAGCGGLSLGFETAGFQVTGFEKNFDACATYRANLSGECITADLNNFQDWPNADILIGGPPCQPFSVLGRQEGEADRRNGLEIFLRAVSAVRPKIWLFENVRGLLGRSAPYLTNVLERLQALGYSVEEPRVLNASAFGVPQNRERVVVIGTLSGKFVWPTAESHTVTVRDAIGRSVNRFSAKTKFLTPAMDTYIAKYEKASSCRTPRDLSPDRVARTLTCRNLGGATGDMIRVRMSDGRRRLLSVSEAARLQSFPPWFRFLGTYSSQMTQVGNAVPPLLALALAKSIHNALKSR